MAKKKEKDFSPIDDSCRANKPGFRFREVLTIASLLLIPFAVGTLAGSDIYFTSVLKSPLTTPACVSIILAMLIADIVLPVPSTIVVMASGALLGFPGGVTVSCVGLLISNAIGYVIGLKTAPERQAIVTHTSMHLFAMAVSKWVPLVSETSAILAGRQKMPVIQFLSASILGVLPFSVFFAFLGHHLGSHAY